MNHIKNIHSMITRSGFLSGVAGLISLTMLTSCEETVRLDLDQYADKVVIEGLVTNDADYQFIKVTRTADFYEPGHTPRITDATVTVTDDLGNEFTFIHNPNESEDSLGIYVPQTPFTGEIGRTYKLRVETDGEVYEAQDQLLAVTAIDSLKYKVDEDEKEDPEFKGRYFNVLLFTKEPQDETNFYFFKFFRNDSLKYESDTDIYYSDDEFLSENINGVESPMYFSAGDHCRVEMYSISRRGYVYYNDLFNLLNNDGGGMFGSVPASPRTNLSNGALGFFQVSALDVSEVDIE